MNTVSYGDLPGSRSSQFRPTFVSPWGHIGATFVFVSFHFRVKFDGWDWDEPNPALGRGPQK